MISRPSPRWRPTRSRQAQARYCWCWEQPPLPALALITSAGSAKTKRPPGEERPWMQIALPFARSAKRGGARSWLSSQRRAEGLPRKKPFALHALALQLAIAAHRFGAFTGALLAGLLIGAAQLHLPEDAFTLHLLFQRLERLVDVVVADDDLQSETPEKAAEIEARVIPEGIFPVYPRKLTLSGRSRSFFGGDP